MAMSDLKPTLEALIFAHGKPLALERMGDIVDEDDPQVLRNAISELQMDYELSGRALTIIEVAGGFQMVTRPIFAESVRRLAKTKQISRVSKPALETIAIIAYKQPITKLEIEDIRGVNVDGVLETLLDRRLIKIRGRKEVIGRPLLYGTSNEFLQYFGLKDLTELPKLEELPEVLGQLEARVQGPFEPQASAPVESGEGATDPGEPNGAGVTAPVIETGNLSEGEGAPS